MSSLSAMRLISLVLGTDRIAEQQVLQEGVDRDILRVNVFLFSYSKKRLRALPVDSPQFPRSLAGLYIASPNVDVSSGWPTISPSDNP